MAQSRNRPGHPYKKPADIPASQRTKGTVTWAILFGIFGILIAFFIVGNDAPGLAIGTAIGVILGYLVGKQMERDAAKKA